MCGQCPTANETEFKSWLLGLERETRTTMPKSSGHDERACERASRTRPATAKC